MQIPTCEATSNQMDMDMEVVDSAVIVDADGTIRTVRDHDDHDSIPLHNHDTTTEQEEEEQEEDDEYDAEYTFEFQLHANANDESEFEFDSYQDLHAECRTWAEEGECNANPPFMLTECVSSCLSHPDVQSDGLLNWILFPHDAFHPHNDHDHNHFYDHDEREDHCVDDHQGDEQENCESWAEEGLCIAPHEQEFMLSQCRRSCLVCIPPPQHRHYDNDGNEEVEEDYPVFDLGPGQRIPLELLSETLHILIQTSHYMSQILNPNLPNIERNPNHYHNHNHNPIVHGGEFYHSTRRACRNKDPLCALWAAQGKCQPNDDNPDYSWMVMNCAPVCHTCEYLDVKIRCPIPPHAVDAFQSTGSSRRLENNVGKDGGDGDASKFDNHDDEDDDGRTMNAMFERIVGERELTPAQIDGGMGDTQMYSPSQDVRIYSRPGGSKGQSTKSQSQSQSMHDNNDTHTIIDGPWVVSISNFLTEEECNYLIQVGKEMGYKRSTESSTLPDGSQEEDFVSEARTSKNAWCHNGVPITSSSENDSNSDNDSKDNANNNHPSNPNHIHTSNDNNFTTVPNVACKDQPIVQRIKDKIALFTTVPSTNSEDLQLLHYTPGQFYKVHHDYIQAHTYLPCGPRILTFFLYLNDVEEGGGTRFTNLSSSSSFSHENDEDEDEDEGDGIGMIGDVIVQPERGKALLWPSVLNEDLNAKDGRTMHEAMEVLKGEKYAANAWLHLRDEQNVDGIECT